MIAASEYSRMTGTGAYAENNAGLGGLAIYFLQSWGCLTRYYTGYQQSVSMPGRPNQFDAKPFNVKLWCQQINNFDIAIVARTGINMKYPW